MPNILSVFCRCIPSIERSFIKFYNEMNLAKAVQQAKFYKTWFKLIVLYKRMFFFKPFMHKTFLVCYCYWVRIVVLVHWGFVIDFSAIQTVPFYISRHYVFQNAYLIQFSAFSFQWGIFAMCRKRNLRKVLLIKKRVKESLHTWVNFLNHCLIATYYILIKCNYSTWKIFF